VDAKLRCFDVISAGEVHLQLGSASRDGQRVFSLRRGAVGAALSLASAGLRVGLVTTLDDDSLGRALLARVAARGVDVDGVSLGVPSRGIVFVQASGHASDVVSYRDEERPFNVPPAWSSAVLLLSGLTPVVSVAGSLCKAARAARRAGSVVVVSVGARSHVWQGRDPRAIRMLLREADVIRYTAHDLSCLGMEAADVRKEARDGAVHVFSNAMGETVTNGPFGEVATERGRGRAPATSAHDGDPVTTALCVALARARGAEAQQGEMWRRLAAESHATR